MSRMRQLDQQNSRAGERRRWLLPCFLALIAVLLSFGQSMPTHVNNYGPQYVTASSGAEADCDQAHEGLGTHCHATVVGTAYARIEPVPALFGEIARGYPMSIAASDRAGRTLRPNLQPPQRLHQA